MIQKIRPSDIRLDRPIRPMVIQKPFGFSSRGIFPKFMPKMPLIKVSGMNRAVNMVSTVTISLVLCAVAEK